MAKIVFHQEVMGALQDVWEKNQRSYIARYLRHEGIRSSQISALVQLLINLEVITPENFNEYKER